MVELASRFTAAEGPRRRALNQAARELLLAESSDWAFLVSQRTAVPYATRRFRGHLHRFHQIREMICYHSIDETWLRSVESQYCLFPRLDFRVFLGAKGKVAP